MLHGFGSADDVPRPSDGLPDELSPSMAAFLDEIYATPDDLTDADLEELAAADGERRQSAEILAALAERRPLRELLAVIFPARRISIVGEVRHAS